MLSFSTSIKLLKELNKRIDSFKIDFIKVILFGFLSTLSELLIIIGIIPLTELLSNPKLNLITIPNLNLTILPNEYFTLYICIIIASIYIRKEGVKYYTNFAYLTGSNLSINILKVFFTERDFPSFMQHTPSEIVSSTTRRVDIVIGSLLIPIFQVINVFFISTGILIVLFIYSPIATSVIVTIISLFYIIIAIANRERRRFVSTKIAEESLTSIEILNSILSSAKIIFFRSTYQKVSQIYNKAEQSFRKNQANALIMSQNPRFYLEGIIYIILTLSVAYYVSIETEKTNYIITHLTLFGVAAQRLLPLAQQLFGSLSVLDSSKKILEEIVEFFTFNYVSKSTKFIFSSDNNAICIKGLNFSYGNYTIFRDFQCFFKLNYLNFISAESGKGKSSLFNILLGLQPYDSGTIKYHKSFGETKNDFIKNTLYIDSNLFIDERTIYDYFCYLADNKLTEKYCLQILQKIQLHHFNHQMLHEDIGFNGNLLSNGERQRLILASLYLTDYKIAFLDEVTSAIDKTNERILFENIDSFLSDKTFLVISHSIPSSLTSANLIEL